MFARKTKVLLVLPGDVVDRARVLAGKATTTLKLSVSLQIVLRGLIEEGLRRRDSPTLLEDFERQARMVRDLRRSARRRMRSKELGDEQHEARTASPRAARHKSRRA